MKRDEKTIAGDLIKFLQQLKDLLGESGKCNPKNLPNFLKDLEYKNSSVISGKIKKCLKKPESQLKNLFDKTGKLENDYKEKFDKSIVAELGTIKDSVNVNLSKTWEPVLNKNLKESLSQALHSFDLDKSSNYGEDTVNSSRDALENLNKMYKKINDKFDSFNCSEMNEEYLKALENRNQTFYEMLKKNDFWLDIQDFLRKRKKWIKTVEDGFSNATQADLLMEWMKSRDVWEH